MSKVTFDRRWIYLMVALMLGVFMYVPFALPVRVDPEVEAFFDSIEKLKPGDAVVVSSDYGPSSEPEIGFMHE